MGKFNRTRVKPLPIIINVVNARLSDFGISLRLDIDTYNGYQWPYY